MYLYYRRGRKGTGGGPSQDDAIDDIAKKVISITPQQMKSLRNPFDDDAEFHSDAQSSDPSIEDPVSVNEGVNFTHVNSAIHIKYYCTTAHTYQTHNNDNNYRCIH